VLLAGLITEQQNGTHTGIPGLDQIPGIGDVFGNQDKSTARTELIIFIRPQIIRDGSDAHVVAEELRSKLQSATGTAAVVPAAFHAFGELEQNVREQIEKVKAHPWIPKDIPVRGFVYDVKTGLLNEVAEKRTGAAGS